MKTKSKSKTYITLLSLKFEYNMYDTKMKMIYKKETLYRALYLFIHKIDDYQHLRHMAPLWTPVNKLKIINQWVTSTRLPHKFALRSRP